MKGKQLKGKKLERATVVVGWVTERKEMNPSNFVSMCLDNSLLCICLATLFGGKILENCVL